MDPGSPSARGTPLEHAVAAALLLVLLLLLILSSLHKRLSNDEWFNLDYGREFLQEGSRAATSPHLPSLAANAAFCLSSGCDRQRLDVHGGERLLVRGPTMACALLLGGLVYLWTRELWGGLPALLALALYVFNPNVLAHGKQVTGDVPASLFSFLAAYGAFGLSVRGRPRDLLLAAAGLAGAALTKATGLVLVPVLVLALLFGPGRAPVRTRLKGVLVLLALFLFLVGLPYAFRGVLATAGSLPLESHALRALLPGWLPMPFPRAYVLGLDFLMVFQEQPTLQRGMNYALGHLSYAPIWYAFPLMFLLKTPLAFLVLLGLGLSRGLSRALAVYVLLPALGILLLFGLCVGPQMGVRYLLPAFPFLTLIAGGAVRAPAARLRLGATGLLVLWNAGSTLSYHPFYMSYFNELIGKRLHAYRYLADSNLDWEDRAFFISRYKEAHPGITISVDPPDPCPGYVLVSANKLVGIIDRQRYRWLRRNFEPIDHVGYSYLLFYVPPERLGEITKRGPSAE
jgi:hypothetical protein